MTEHLGLQLDRRDEGVGRDPRTLVGLALRRNPNRPYLLVSSVLGKHVPAPPSVVIQAGLDLASAIRRELDWQYPDLGLAMGFAETATELGHRVATDLGLPYVHSTRREPLNGDRALRFEEEHSHATTHYLNPRDPGLLDATGPVVLVDDELTTGRTAINTISGLRTRNTSNHYVLATLVDMRPPEAIARMEEFAQRLGIRLDVVSLAAGRIRIPETVGSYQSPGTRQTPTSRPRPEPEVDVHTAASWPHLLPQSGSDGVVAHADRAMTAAARRLADEPPFDTLTGRVHVLGHEEFMHVPLEVAAALADRGLDVTFSSTTRSPVEVVDEDGYAVRTAVTFASADDGTPRHAYNLPKADHLVVLIEPHVDLARTLAVDGLVPALGTMAPRIHVVVLP